MYATFCFFFPRTALQTAHNNECAPLPYKVWRPLRTTQFAVLFMLAACSWRAATFLLIYILAPHIVAQEKSPYICSGCLVTVFVTLIRTVSSTEGGIWLCDFLFYFTHFWIGA
jgi:hypothetical protein